MKHPVLRSRLTLAPWLAAAALAAAGPAAGDPGKGQDKGNPHGQPPGQTKKDTTTTSAKSVQGVVQSVWPTGALIRLLDGRTVNVTLNHHTKILVDGRPSRLSAVRPGYVLVGIGKSGPLTILRFVRPS